MWRPCAELLIGYLAAVGARYLSRGLLPSAKANTSATASRNYNLSMETLLSTVRAIILVGAVCFAFGLLFFGFHVVVREYRMLRTRKQMEDFLRMTNEAGLQADIAKGTLSLNRTRPGVLLIGIGAVLLIVCVLQPFQYETSSQQTSGGWVRLPTRVEREALNSAPAPVPSTTPTSTPAPTATPADAGRAPAQNTPIMLAYPAPVPRPVPAPTTTRPAGEQTRGVAPPRITVDMVETLRRETLDKWLAEIDVVKGKKLGEQAQILRARYGDEAVGFDSFMLDKSSTVREMAEMAYGDAKYAPLLRASNPQLPGDDSPIPPFKTVYFLQPLLALAQPSTSASRTLLRVTAGESKEQLYETVSNMAEQVMQSPEYRRDPTAWWNTRGGVPEFERGLTKNTGRKWGEKFYKPEPNESAETVAKIFYGSAKYAPLLAFFNYDRPELFADTKAPFPADTQLLIVLLTEF